MKKQEILAEVRRTAAENGGKPLGRERFYRETGISESDWLGKYWARWGDAIRESGLHPNQVQGAHDEAALIERFISLMRELGKFPTSNEVKLKARNTPGFPWHNTFARLGSKQQLAKRIQEYCNWRAEYGDVAALCADVATEAPALPENDGEETLVRKGYVESKPERKQNAAKRQRRRVFIRGAAASTSCRMVAARASCRKPCNASPKRRRAGRNKYSQDEVVLAAHLPVGFMIGTSVWMKSSPFERSSSPRLMAAA